MHLFLRLIISIIVAFAGTFMVMAYQSNFIPVREFVEWVIAISVGLFFLKQITNGIKNLNCRNLYLI